MRGSSWSTELAKLAVWLYGHVEDDVAEQIMLQVGGIAVSDTSIWQRMRAWGEKVKALVAEEMARAMLVPQQGRVVRGESKIKRRMGVAMDGAMIHIRGEGWKELKVGCVFDIELQGAAGDDKAGIAHAVHNSYSAVLGARYGQRPIAGSLREQWRASF